MSDQGEPYTVADAARETRDLVHAPGRMAHPFGSVDWRFLPTQIKEYDGRALRSICLRLLDTLEAVTARAALAERARDSIDHDLGKCTAQWISAAEELDGLRGLLREMRQRVCRAVAGAAGYPPASVAAKEASDACHGAAIKAFDEIEALPACDGVEAVARRAATHIATNLGLSDKPGPDGNECDEELFRECVEEAVAHAMGRSENQEQGEEPDACAADVPGDPGRPAPSTPHPLGD